MLIKIGGKIIENSIQTIKETSHIDQVLITHLPKFTKDAIKEQVQEWILGTLSGIGSVLSQLSFTIALIGGGICIILYVMGWKDGARWVSILTAANVIIRVLLGGL